jgi:hypothetical protein
MSLNVRIIVLKVYHLTFYLYNFHNTVSEATILGELYYMPDFLLLLSNVEINMLELIIITCFRC